MRPWLPNERRLLALLCVTTTLGAALELARVREVAVATSTVRTSAFVVFAFLNLFFGVGCWLSERPGPAGPRATLLACSVTAGLALVGTLAMQPGDGLSIAAGLTAICAFFTAAGLLYGSLLIGLVRDAGRAPAHVVGASGAALLVGLLGSGPLVG